MRKIIRNLIRRFVPQTDREAGFTLLELIVAIASFTIICAGLTTLLITALRIEKYTADNTQYRETVKPMHDQFVEPSKRKANIIIPEGGRNDAAMEVIVELIRSRLR